jgi:alpha-beta hydrolase superfamily lysophospholipase
MIMTDSAAASGGYWIFEPDQPRADSAPVVLFLHGFGCYNPMIYGEWIRHLVRKGNVVIMPRYQDRLLSPHSRDFQDVAALGIRRALAELEARGKTRLQWERTLFIGHSYGGVISARLALDHQSLGIPKPAAILLCQPGINIFRGGRIKEYRPFPEGAKAVIILSRFDFLAGQGVGKKIYRANAHLPDTELITIRPGHRACHATDPALDNGVRTFSARYALYRISTDETDYGVFWKIADKLLMNNRLVPGLR